MVWKPTAMTLIWAPVRRSKSGARRWSGSATWGPLNVRMLTLTPLNLSPCGGCDAAAPDAGADAPGAADAGAVALGVAGAHADARSARLAKSPAPRRDQPFRMCPLLDAWCGYGPSGPFRKLTDVIPRPLRPGFAAGRVPATPRRPGTDVGPGFPASSRRHSPAARERRSAPPGSRPAPRNAH